MSHICAYRAAERPRPLPVQPPPAAPPALDIRRTPSPPKPSDRKVGQRSKRSASSPGPGTGTPPSDPNVSPTNDSYKVRKITVGGPRSSPKNEKKEAQSRHAHLISGGQSFGGAEDRAEAGDTGGEVSAAIPTKVERAPEPEEYVPKFLKPGALDESWFTEYVGREPQMTPDLVSNEQFDEAQVGSIIETSSAQLQMVYIQTMARRCQVAISMSGFFCRDKKYLSLIVCLVFLGTVLQ